MGLFTTSFSEELNTIAKSVHNTEIEKMEEMSITFNSKQKQVMLDGTLDELNCLIIAVKLNEKYISSYYSNWLYSLLCNHSKFISSDYIKPYLINHYTIIMEHIEELFTGEDIEKAKDYIRQSIEDIENGIASKLGADYINDGDYAEKKKILLDYLLKKDTYLANIHIKNLAKNMPLEELYTNIIQKTMQEVGELWYQNKITVAQEHYCTAAMQNILSQFYEVLYKAPRQEKKVVVACPGTELHEMGARMIADLFTNNGWDSIYLGSAVPVENILDVITEEKPQVCALSASMPQGIEACLSTAKLIKEQFPNIIICVGGRAFDGLEDIEEKMGVDIYSKSFPELKEKLSKFAV